MLGTAATKINKIANSLSSQSLHSSGERQSISIVSAPFAKKSPLYPPSLWDLLDGQSPGCPNPLNVTLFHWLTPY